MQQSPKSEAFEGVEHASKILANGWWQGSIVNASVFETEEAFPLVSHWVIASQTCNLFNPDFKRVGKVEWVGGRLIQKETLEPTVQHGANARRLHARLSSSVGMLSYIELNINDRLWTDRTELADHLPEAFRIADTGPEPHEREREILANWLGRSYTRAEFPSEFNEGIEQCGLRTYFRKLIRGHAAKIFGIFIEIGPLDYDLDKGSLSNEQIARLKPPYQIINLTIVATDEEHIKTLQSELARLSALTIDDPIPPPPNTPRVKVSRLDMAKRHQIHLDPAHIDVVPLEGWTMRDLLTTFRYTDHDYLSGVDELPET